jgi:hypothetical protein
LRIHVLIVRRFDPTRFDGALKPSDAADRRASSQRPTFYCENRSQLIDNIALIRCKLAALSSQETFLLPSGVELSSLTAAGDGNLGLCCDKNGLSLGRTPLIERRDGRFVVRPRSDLERLFKHSSSGADLDRLMRGLAVIRCALDESNLCLAQIAAVQLRIPDLPGLLARAALEAEDRLIKTERGGDVLARAGWDPDEHPLTGAPPNPGWFAPTGGSNSGGSAQVAQGEEDERAPEEILDPMAQLRQARWDARIDVLRRLDRNNPNLVYLAPPGPPAAEAVARLDAEVKTITARVADKLAHGHAWGRHASEFPEVSTESQLAHVIQSTISNPLSVVRPLSRGRTAFYEESTNTLVIGDPDARDFGTTFRPAGGRVYVNQLE